MMRFWSRYCNLEQTGVALDLEVGDKTYCLFKFTLSDDGRYIVVERCEPDGVLHPNTRYYLDQQFGISLPEKVPPWKALWENARLRAALAYLAESGEGRCTSEKIPHYQSCASIAEALDNFLRAYATDKPGYGLHWLKQRVDGLVSEGLLTEVEAQRIREAPK